MRQHGSVGLTARWTSVALAVIALSGTSACGGASPAATSASVTYSCCRASDANTVYRPGEVLRVHWIVHYPAGMARTARPGPRSTTLTARLLGPFGTVQTLKSGGRAPSASVARPLQVPSSGRAGSPVSQLRIPASAAHGLYNLETSVRDSSGDVVSSGSVVRIRT